jgi:hypothetical protein
MKRSFSQLVGKDKVNTRGYSPVPLRGRLCLPVSLCGSLFPPLPDPGRIRLAGRGWV